jgi:hypothetical protein
MKMKKIFLPFLSLALLLTAFVAHQAHAEDQINANVNVSAQAQPQSFWGRMFHFGGGDDSKSNDDNNNDGKGGMMGNALFGTVTAVNGNTITVTDTRSNTVYTVDATNAKIDKNRATITVSSIAVGDSVFVEGPKNGTTVTASAIHDGIMAKGNMMGEGVGGTVTAISGSTITISSKDKSNTTTSYTVNAANATIEKNGVAGTLSSVVVGDEIRVQGTVSGTTVTATKIMDGKFAKPMMPQGNGQPVVGGTVTAISGSTITITNMSNVSYTINATNSTFIKNGKTATISDIAVGDSIVTQGTVNGTAITATSVTDQGNIQANNNEKPHGFFGKIGNFFAHMFGF